MRVRVLPGVPISFTIYDFRLTIFAALVQLPETLRSERRGWGWKSLTRYQFQMRKSERGARNAECRTRPGKTPHSALRIPHLERRLASAGTADPGDLKSPSLPGASP